MRCDGELKRQLASMMMAQFREPGLEIMSDLFSVAGQIVVVSGGTRGIGYAIAAGFAQRGACVVVTGRTTAAAERAASELRAGAMFPPLAIACDVSDSGQVRQLAATVNETFGRVDTLINVAGVNRRKPA